MEATGTTKQLICDVARRLFEERGYANVTMRDIALESGLAVGNLTYHFPKKGDLVARLQLDKFEELQGTGDEGDQDQPALPWFDSFLRVVQQSRDENAFLYRDPMSILEDSPTIAGNTARFQVWLYDTFVRRFGELVSEGLAREDLTSQEYEDVAYAIVLMTQYWMQRGGLYDNEGVPRRNSVDGISAILSTVLTERGLREWRTLRSQ